jgi:hypothetical protein
MALSVGFRDFMIEFSPNPRAASGSGDERYVEWNQLRRRARRARKKGRRVAVL